MSSVWRGTRRYVLTSEQAHASEVLWIPRCEHDGTTLQSSCSARNTSVQTLSATAGFGTKRAHKVQCEKIGPNEVRALQLRRDHHFEGQTSRGVKTRAVFQPRPTQVNVPTRHHFEVQTSIRSDLSVVPLTGTVRWRPGNFATQGNPSDVFVTKENIQYLAGLVRNRG
jgi:hypothetical protein